MVPPDTAQIVHSLLTESWPPDAWRDTGVVLAVSGGPDSVALLRAVMAVRREGKGRVVVAHFNHRLRAEDADADEQFVCQLAEQFQLACRVGSMDQPPGKSHRGESLEGFVRKARYRFLKQVACELGARYVATGHTADDQVETILHRIVRGTGLRGLAGMPKLRRLNEAVSLVRPLLGVRRVEILAYLASLGQEFCRDATNDSLRWTRNRIRNRLLPQLAAEYNPRVTDALLRLGSLAAEAQGLVDRQAAELLQQAVREEPGGKVRIHCPRLAGQPALLVRELLVTVWRTRGWPLRAMGFRHWEELRQLIEAAGGSAACTAARRMFPGRVVVRAQPGELVLLREAAGS